MADNIGELSEVALALESSYGTAITSFSKGLMVTNFQSNPVLTAERVVEMDGQLLAKRSSAGIITYAPSFGFVLDAGDTSVTSLGEMLASLLGDDVLTGSTDPFVHTLAKADNAEPPSFTLYRKTGKDGIIKKYSGFRVGSIKLSIVANAVSIPVEITGIAKEETTNASQVLTFTDIPLLVPSQAVLSIDSSQDNNFETFEITFTRALEGVPTVSGSRFINRLPAGQITVDIVMNGVEPGSSETLRNKFLALHDNSAEQIRIDLDITQSASRKLEINLPKCFFSVFDGPDHAEGLNRISTTAAALRDSGLNVIITNAVSTAYDA